MTPTEQERERRDGLVFLFSLPLAIALMLVAGQFALRFAPHWSLPASMASNLNPDASYLGPPAGGQVEPVLVAILTPPAWQDTFLTPQPSETTGNIPIPLPTSTKSARSTPTHRPTATATPVPATPRGTSATPTATSTTAPTATSTTAPTSSPTFAATSTPHAKATNTATSTKPPSPTQTPTQTSPATNTPTGTSTSNPTRTPSYTPTLTPTSTSTATSTSTPTSTETPTPMDTSLATDTPTAMPTLTPLTLEYDCAGAANHYWRISNPNHYRIDFNWSGDIYSGSDRAHPGWNTFTTPLGSGGYSVTVTYPGGSASASSNGDTCNKP